MLIDRSLAILHTLRVAFRQFVDLLSFRLRFPNVGLDPLR